MREEAVEPPHDPGSPEPIPHPRSSGEMDLELVRAVLADPNAHVEELGRRFDCLPRILRALDARLGCRLQPDDLRDIGQDALVLAWQKLPEYGGDARLESWLYGIARLELLNAVRRIARRSGRPEDFEALQRVESEDAPPGISLDYEVLHRGLAALEPEISVVVRLKHFEDLTLEQIGQRLGISTNTVKTRYYRGLSRLEDRLRSTFGPGEER